jgi:hypothetical protein
MKKHLAHFFLKLATINLFASFLLIIPFFLVIFIKHDNFFFRLLNNATEMELYNGLIYLTIPKACFTGIMVWFGVSYLCEFILLILVLIKQTTKL